MKQALREKFRQNEENNPMFTRMLDEELDAEKNSGNTNMFREKIGKIKTISKKEIKEMLADF